MMFDPKDALFSAYHTEEINGRYDQHLMFFLTAGGEIKFSNWFRLRNTDEQALLLIQYLERNYTYDTVKNQWMRKIL